MKQQEFKKLLKPLIKECIKEVVFEEGILSNIIVEVACGLSNSGALLTDANQKQDPRINQLLENTVSELDEEKQLLKQRFQQQLNIPKKEKNTLIKEETGKSPLRGISPENEGVNLSGLINLTGGWKQIGK